MQRGSHLGRDAALDVFSAGNEAGRGCPSRNKVSFEICFVSSPIGSDVAGTGLERDVGTVDAVADVVGVTESSIESAFPNPDVRPAPNNLLFSNAFALSNTT